MWVLVQVLASSRYRYQLVYIKEIFYVFLQELAGSPQRSAYMWKQQPEANYHHYPPTSDPASPVHSHSYAQQVGYFLQQSVPIPTVQSGGPRTTPSGYPGGPVVPPGQVSPKMNRRQLLQDSSPYSDNVIRTSANMIPHSSGPLTFTRALEVTDSLAGAGVRGVANNGAVPPRHVMGGDQGDGGGADHRESVYDMNYEISV